jgi:hypothetical protein
MLATKHWRLIKTRNDVLPVDYLEQDWAIDRVDNLLMTELMNSGIGIGR